MQFHNTRFNQLITSDYFWGRPTCFPYTCIINTMRGTCFLVTIFVIKSLFCSCSWSEWVSHESGGWELTESRSSIRGSQEAPYLGAMPCISTERRSERVHVTQCMLFCGDDRVIRLRGSRWVSGLRCLSVYMRGLRSRGAVQCFSDTWHSDNHKALRTPACKRWRTSCVAMKQRERR